MTESTFFTKAQLDSLDHSKIPKHIAIIPDGNRRWAKNKLFNPQKGHHYGANKLIEIVKAAKEIGIKTLTFYLFSTENWIRPKREVNFLMSLIKEFLNAQCEEMIKSGVHLDTIGDLSKLPDDVIEIVKKSCERTAQCNKINMIMALNYGARDEIRRAFDQILTECYNGKLKKEQVTESLIAQHLDTAPWGDPDLLIRTSGEMRISNFLLWQLSYAEIYVTDILWPDFTPNDLLTAVLDYRDRNRRWGT